MTTLAPSREYLHTLRRDLPKRKTLFIGRRILGDPCEPDETKVVLTLTSNDMDVHLVTHMKRDMYRQATEAQVLAAFHAEGGETAASLEGFARNGASRLVPYLGVSTSRIPTAAGKRDEGFVRLSLVDDATCEALTCRLTVAMGNEEHVSLSCPSVELGLAAGAWEAHLRRITAGRRRLIVTLTGAGAHSLDAQEMMAVGLTNYVRKVLDTAACAAAAGFHLMLSVKEVPSKRQR